MITLVSAVAIASLCVFQTQRALENESVRLWKTLVNQILSVYHLCRKGDPPLAGWTEQCWAGKTLGHQAHENIDETFSRTRNDFVGLKH